MNTTRAFNLGLNVGLALVLAFVVAGRSSPASAAILVDLKVTGVSGQGDTFSDKTASIQQGDVVTVGIYLSGMSSVSGNLGLANYSVSVRSFSETYNSGTAWTTPTVASTVVNATSAVLPTLDASFLSKQQGATVLKDINAAISNPDPSDTDTDVQGFGASQSSTPYTENLGMTDGFLLGTVQFTANTDATKAAPWSVHLNTYYTSATGSNGGVYVLGMTSPTVVTADLATGTSNIGSDIVVTVNSVPEPTIIPGLGLLGLLLRRWRRRV